MTEADKLILSLQDPSTNMPAATTLLYRVCDNDPTKFEEGCRILELFINAALEKK